MGGNAAFFLVVLVLVVSIAWVIISWYNYRLKKRIIDSGPINQEALNFVKKMANPGFDALKWGCILFAGGLGLVVANCLPFGLQDSPAPYGIELMFIAGGFLTYYFIVRKQQKP